VDAWIGARHVRSACVWCAVIAPLSSCM
jgi:hypothetical protein